jgi:hypothetical protein
MVCSFCSITGLDLTPRDGYQDLGKGTMIMGNRSYYQMICKAFYIIKIGSLRRVMCFSSQVDICCCIEVSYE